MTSTLPFAAYSVLKALNLPAKWWLDIDPGEHPNPQIVRQMESKLMKPLPPSRLRRLRGDVIKLGIQQSATERATLYAQVQAAPKVVLEGKFLNSTAATLGLRRPYPFSQILSKCAVKFDSLWLEFDASHFGGDRYDHVAFLVRRHGDPLKWSVVGFNVESYGEMRIFPFSVFVHADGSPIEELPEGLVALDTELCSIPSDGHHTPLGMATNDDGETRFLAPRGFERSFVLCAPPALGKIVPSGVPSRFGFENTPTPNQSLIKEAGFLRWVISALFVGAHQEFPEHLDDSLLEEHDGTFDQYFRDHGISVPPHANVPDPLGWASLARNDDEIDEPSEGVEIGTPDDRPIAFRGVSRGGEKPALLDRVKGLISR